MSECFSARCQHDRKIARREFHKWNKNLLFQIGLETIATNHFEFDINPLINDQTLPVDFNPDESCLFCVNRQEHAARQIPTMKTSGKNRHSTMWFNDEQEEILDEYMSTDENAPLDLSLKTAPSLTTTSSAYESLIASANRTNAKQRSFYDVKSDIPPSMFTQEELDRVMDDIVAGRIDLPPQAFANMNLFANDNDRPQYGSLPSISTSYSYHHQHPTQKKTHDVRINQLAKQMAYDRFIQEVDYQRHHSLGNSKKSTNSMATNKRSFHSSLNTPPSIVHSFPGDVNQILNDLMLRMVYEILEEQMKKCHQQQLVPTPPVKITRKGEVLFVKKKNDNIDEQYNSMNQSIFNHLLKTNSTKKQIKRSNKVNPSSSSASSTSSTSSTYSSNTHTKDSHKIKSNNVSLRREEADNNHSKIVIGQDGKQIRPKRGQYRRYESEQLAKAVAAVLSNEMSVHKAGSYFGVPHSTLEYKVKERNIKVTPMTKSKGACGSSSHNILTDSQESSHHQPLLSVSPSVSMNDNNNNIPETQSFSHDYDDNDDDDENSAKGLAAFLPPSNSNNTKHCSHQESDSENASEQDEGEEEEYRSFAPIELEMH